MFTATVSANALTIATDAGNLVIAAGDLHGASNGLPFRLWVTNNGALSADICTGQGFIKRPRRPLGFVTWEAGLPVAGQWSTAGDGGIAWSPGDPLPGDLLQSVAAPAAAQLTVAAPIANHWYETNLFASVSPVSACNPVMASWAGNFYTQDGNSNQGCAALFRNGVQVGFMALPWSATGGIIGATGDDVLDFPGSGASRYAVMIRSQSGSIMAFSYNANGIYGGMPRLTLTEFMG